MWKKSLLLSFFELVMDYNKHIKQWFIKVEGVSHPKVVHNILIMYREPITKNLGSL